MPRPANEYAVPQADGAGARDRRSLRGTGSQLGALTGTTAARQCESPHLIKSQARQGQPGRLRLPFHYGDSAQASIVRQRPLRG